MWRYGFNSTTRFEESYFGDGIFADKFNQKSHCIDKYISYYNTCTIYCRGFKMDDIKHKRVIDEFKRNFADVCKSPDTGTCDDTAEYRTANGSCNNLNNKTNFDARHQRRRRCF